MKSSFLVHPLSIFSILVTPIVLYGQAIDPNAQSKPGYKLEMRLGPLVGGPASVVKEVGDDVQVRQDGAIVAKSRSRSHTYLPTNRMHPNVRTAYSLSNGKVEYNYQVSNGPSGVDSIGSFALVISSPAEIVCPNPWTALKIAKPNESPTLGFLPVVKDGDPKGGLPPGAGLDAIRITSDLGPGLIDTTFYPASVPAGSPGAQRLEADFFNRASPWVQNRLLELDTRDRRQVRGLTIGPVTPLASDSVEQVLAEIQAVIQRPQFAVLRERALLVPAPADSAALQGWLAELRKASPLGIVAEFVDAMAWRLQRMQSR